MVGVKTPVLPVAGWLVVEAAAKLNDVKYGWKTLSGAW